MLFVICCLAAPWIPFDTVLKRRILGGEGQVDRAGTPEGSREPEDADRYICLLTLCLLPSVYNLLRLLSLGFSCPDLT